MDKTELNKREQLFVQHSNFITGQIVKKIRVEKAISLLDLSRITGVSVATISLIENGKQQATISYLIQFSLVTETPLGAIIERIQCELEDYVDNQRYSEPKPQRNRVRLSYCHSNERNLIDELGKVTFTGENLQQEIATVVVKIKNQPVSMRNRTFISKQIRALSKADTPLNGQIVVRNIVETLQRRLTA